MTASNRVKIYTQTSPGELRAAAYDAMGRPFRLFSERWGGGGERARYGAVVEARLRKFAETLRGAFCELDTGEQAFLRLKSRQGLTEGQALRVRIESEARFEKSARVVITDAPLAAASGLKAWSDGLSAGTNLETIESTEWVAPAFEDALAPSVTLQGGGKLYVERTRALTAFDIDSAGRLDKGSAGARALAINQDAIVEMARQVSLRGLGGAVVLDCLSPINADAGDRLRAAGQRAFEQVALAPAKVLKPSPLGLLEASVPWRYMPIEDARAVDPAETDLLDLLRHVQAEADAARTKFFTLSLGAPVWQAYQSRKSETDSALHSQFAGRISVRQSETDKSEVVVP